MNIPGSIPVRRYLKKYILFTENLKPDETLDLTRRGTIPRFLGLLLVGKLNQDYQQNGYIPEDNYFDDLLHYRIDLWRSRQGKIIMTWEGVKLFDAFVYDSFHDYLLGRIIYDRDTNNGKEKHVIEQVMHELDIVEDISFDALKKSQLRLRNLREIPHFRVSKCI